MREDIATQTNESSWKEHEMNGTSKTKSKTDKKEHGNRRW